MPLRILGMSSARVGRAGGIERAAGALPGRLGLAGSGRRRPRGGQVLVVATLVLAGLGIAFGLLVDPVVRIVGEGSGRESPAPCALPAAATAVDQPRETAGSAGGPQSPPSGSGADRAGTGPVSDGQGRSWSSGPNQSASTAVARAAPSAAKSGSPVDPHVWTSSPVLARIDLGSHTHRITTASPEAQHAFDRGLTLAYAFSHRAAESEFRRAAALDPGCAMAWWGVALVNGPHINFPLVPPDRAQTAWEALGRARDLAPAAGDTERALIQALGARYVQNQPEDRQPLDRAYAAAMREVWRAHPEDADVGALFAEAMMDLRPWDLWTAEGKPQPGTQEIVLTLERVLAIDPGHPGANHFYIHVMEASPHPEKALAAADRTRYLVPGAGHLMHMPAHIYARVGRWVEAVAANERAIAADAAVRAADPEPGFYAMYMAHNHHFLAYAHMMQGRSAEALDAARAMIRDVPEELWRDFAPLIDGYAIFPSEVLMRFGRWEEMLSEPEPRVSMLLSRALWRFTRAVALTALGRLEEAEREREAFRRQAEVLPKWWSFGNNNAAQIVGIAANLLDGEMRAKRNNFEAAVASLAEAVRLEDRLHYNEPPDWMQPVRHTLGAVLLRAGRYPEAEGVYRQDLARHPDNGWSLFGLSRALTLQGKAAKAAQVRLRFDRVWSSADVKPRATCYCQPGV